MDFLSALSALSSVRLFSRCATVALAALLTLAAGAPLAHAQETGAVAGVIVDGETGETLPGANVVVVGTQNGTSTGVDGRYRIEGLAPGSYDVEYSFVSYQPKTVTGVDISAGETATLDVTLSPATAELEEVVVTAQVARNSEAGLLRNRQKAAAVSNAISAEAISESGSSNAADAMEKVTGASVIGGKYVNVRGLGGRYVNTTLNGAELPSADPDENAVPFDLFPSSLLENIVTSKTFTPDKAGNFTGGSIDIGTIAFPGEMSLSVSSSLGYNTQSGFGDGQVGYVEGLNEIPEVVRGGVPGAVIRPNPQYAQRAQEIDQATDAFSPNLSPLDSDVPLQQSYELSFGNEFDFMPGERPIGLVATASYNQNVGGYAGGLVGRSPLNSPNAEVLDTEQYRLTNDETSSVEDVYSGLANLSFRPFEKHEIGANVLYTRSEERVGRITEGRQAREFLSGDLLRTRVTRKSVRTARTVQARGNHQFAAGLTEELFGSQTGLQFQWNGALNYNEQDEPDYRQFANEVNDDGSFAGFNRAYDRPTRYFRNMQQGGYSSDASLTIPIASLNFKTGASYTQKDREFRQRRFVYIVNGDLDYEENPEVFFGELGGIIGEGSDGRPNMGNYIQESTEANNNFDGAQNIAAGFAMVDVPLGSFLRDLGASSDVPVLSRLRVIGGVRLERTDQSIDTYMGSLSFPLPSENFEEAARIEGTDWLPSLNLVYNLTEEMNVRGAYGRTLARPSFREFSTSCFAGQITGIQVCGANFRQVQDADGNLANQLDRTQVDNFDVRWEWFPSGGEVLAVSGFYKDFTNAIVRTFLPLNNATITYANAPNANVMGVEIEARKRLGFLGSQDWLEHFEVGGNLTLAQSNSEVPVELPEGGVTFVDRPLQGQSPYLINANTSYENPSSGTSVSLYYNVFGNRLDAITRDAAFIEDARQAPDRYEQARHTLDFNFSQTFRPVGLRDLRLKIKAKNLLGAQNRIVREYRDVTYPVENFELGRSFSMGVEYRL